MIGSIRGRIASKTPPQLMVDVGGIGYEINFAYNSFDNATMYPLIVLILLASIAINTVLTRWEKTLLARRGAR